MDKDDFFNSVKDWSCIVAGGSDMLCSCFRIGTRRKYGTDYGWWSVKRLDDVCTFFGRYVLITYVFFFLMGFTMGKIEQRRKQDEIPGDSLVLGMPLVTASVAATVLVVFMFFV